MNPIDRIIAITLHSPDGDSFTAWDAYQGDIAIPLIITVHPDGTFDIRQEPTE